MAAETSNYWELPDEGTYIDFLRARLPFSFERIELRRNRGFSLRRRSGASRYVLSEPKLHEGMFSATYHNYWKRGHAFYLAGKLLDCHWLSGILNSYRVGVGFGWLQHLLSRHTRCTLIRVLLQLDAVAEVVGFHAGQCPR